MTVITEGQLQFTFNDVVSARKFDGPDHGLNHCMKAVDFIVELANQYLFVEIKDPQDSRAMRRDSKRWIERFISGGIDRDLQYKYRDTFLYEWASGRADKPIVYVAPVALDSLDTALLEPRQSELNRNLPISGPNSQPWNRPIVRRCLIFNIDSWNRTFPNYPVSRMTQ